MKSSELLALGFKVVGNQAIRIEPKERKKRRKREAPKDILVSIVDGVATLHALPIVTLNSRMHPIDKAAWAKPFKAAGRAAAEDLGITAACRIVITRYSPAKFLDSDNLAGSLKAVRDGIAAAVGTDDGEESAGGWEWIYRQGRSGRDDARVEIEAEP